MNDLFGTVARWLVRLIVVALGLVLFLSVLAFAVLLASVWMVRALWARITGRPVTPWVFRMDPRRSWSNMQRAGAQWTSAAHGSARAADLGGTLGARGRGMPAAEVTDVEARELP